MRAKSTIFALLALSMSLVACETNTNTPIEQNSKEEAFKSAIEAYIDNTVVPTYRGMADNALLLAEACAEIQQAHTDGILTTELIAEAGNYWKESRCYWEESEAVLFGAAADYTIDPQIDSWLA